MRESIRSVTSNRSVKSTKSTKSTVSYETMTQLDTRTRIFYSFGHIYNDLCASVWFSYTLLYFKLNFDDSTAGMLLMLGQVADAISTPLIGYGSDKNFNHFICRYGRRKIWHLIGSICVSCSFPFIFNACFVCDDSELWIKLSYYSVFIALFQFGWACVQVSHVSLITDLTTISSQRVELNAYRQAATVASSICVYTITLALLGVEETTIDKRDTIIFMKVVHLISVIGVIFSILFHLFVREPSHVKTMQYRESLGSDHFEGQRAAIFRERAGSCYSVNVAGFGSNKNISKIDKIMITNRANENRVSLLEPDIKVEFSTERKNQKIWSDWLKSINFWRMCLIYMMSRLFVNLTQVYTPLYLQESLKLAKRNIAIVPFITYFTGFVFSLIAKPMSSKVGSKYIMTIGCIFGILSCFWILLGGLSITLWQVFSVAALFGVGGTAMLIGSLSLTADLIDDNILSGAFVFGAMSFFDKLVNGAVIAVIQNFNPLSTAFNISVTVVPVNNSLSSRFDQVLGPNSSFIEPIEPIEPNNINNTDFNRKTVIQTPEKFYLQILVFVSGAAVVMTFIALMTILRAKFARKHITDKKGSESEAKNERRQRVIPTDTNDTTDDTIRRSE